MDKLYDNLIELVGKENIEKDADMKNHTTFRAGGKAEFLVTPVDIESTCRLYKYLYDNNIKYYFIGNGSNLLVRDEGFDGVIVKFGNNFSDIETDGEEIKCGAGCYLSKVANVAKENSLKGMEFAAGIPGFIGGAIAMNAGAYGGEMKDIVKEVVVINKNGDIKNIPGAEMDFSYRHSKVLDEKYIVISVILSLKKGNKDEIIEEMDGLQKARKDKQPLEYPSAGSTFKRPEGYFAGKLIEDSGLRGYSVGDACVSEKHCGFVVNKGNASATDIINLIKHVQDKVYKDSGVVLEPEVKIL